uniref:Uncharacterized protein n=1 Tax=Lygus hesperus TaxID=30085 RepID=A0A146KMA0_LYGHE
MPGGGGGVKRSAAISVGSADNGGRFRGRGSSGGAAVAVAGTRGVTETNVQRRSMVHGTSGDQGTGTVDGAATKSLSGGKNSKGSTEPCTGQHSQKAVQNSAGCAPIDTVGGCTSGGVAQSSSKRPRSAGTPGTHDTVQRVKQPRIGDGGGATRGTAPHVCGAEIGGALRPHSTNSFCEVDGCTGTVENTSNTMNTMNTRNSEMEKMEQGWTWIEMESGGGGLSKEESELRDSSFRDTILQDVEHE